MNTPLIDRRQCLGRFAGATLLPALPLAAWAQTPPWKPTQTITYGIGVAAAARWTCMRAASRTRSKR